jgi:hypothetical protein
MMGRVWRAISISINPIQDRDANPLGGTQILYASGHADRIGPQPISMPQVHCFVIGHAERAEAHITVECCRLEGKPLGFIAT